MPKDCSNPDRLVAICVDGAPVSSSNPIPTTGGGGGGGGAVTIADGAHVTFGAQADAAASTDTGTFSFMALFKRLLQKFTAQFPAALTGSGNFKVAIQESIPAGTAVIGAVTMQPSVVTLTDAATLSITSGGASQQVFASNASAKIRKVQNLSTGDLYLNWNGSATIDNNSFKLLPNAEYESPPHAIDQRALNIIGATTGQKFAAKEG